MNKRDYLAVRNQLDFLPKRRKFLAHVGQDLALLAASMVLLRSGGWPGICAAQALLAIFYFRAFSLMHEAVHGSLWARGGRVNDWIGVIYGGLSFLPYTTWKSIHLDHHKWVGNIEKDPTSKMVREFPGRSSTYKRIASWIWKSWIPYTAFLQEIVFWHVSLKRVLGGEVPKEKRVELLASLVAPLMALGAVLGIGWYEGSALLLLPSIAMYLVLVEVINFPHHLRLPRLSGDSALGLWDQHKVSRTCVYAPWFSSFVLLNFNYHSEHHLFPNLPWHELPKAYELIRTEPDYHFCRSNEWILENRRRELGEVFAPTGAVESERKAA